MSEGRLCLRLVVWALVVIVMSSTAMATIANENHKRIEKRHRQESKSPDEASQEENGLLYLGDLFQGVSIRSALSDQFNDVYLRNKAEIHEIMDQNPGIVWETVGLAIELLPALRSAGRNGGSLTVDKKLYARANNLYGRCERLASPRLVSDMKKARALVEGRTTEQDANHLLIDLKE